MIGGIHWRKLAVYSLLIAALLGANYYRLYRDTGPQNSAQPTSINTPSTEFPVLFAAREFQGSGAESNRDLFLRTSVATPPPVVAQPNPQPPPRIDPNAAALANAQKLIDGVVLLGILGTDEGPVAVIEFDQEVKSATQGQTIAAGFKITELTLRYLVVRNELLGLEKKIVVGE